MPRGSFLITFLLMVAGLAAQTAPPAQAQQSSQPAPLGAARPGLPSRDQPRVQTGTGKIRGKVFSADTNAPLRRALVTLVSGQLSLRRSTTSDADGWYEFKELAGGRYTASASKGGYVTLQFGQRRAFESGIPIALADAQELTQVDFALPRGSVIAGRITDEFGEPVAGANVQLQRFQYGPSGQRRLTYAGGGAFSGSNDLGEFRAYGLMPGDYIVSSTVRLPTFQQAASVNDVSEGYAPTFYPGTTNLAEAEAVSVGLGEEVMIHLALQPARLAHVSGVVTNSEGKPLGDIRLMLRSISGDSAMWGSSGATTADGTFTIGNVPPGEHYIDIAGQARTPDAPAEFASVPVTVAGEDVTNVRITTGRGATVSGVVVFEGTAPRGSTPMRVVTQPADLERGNTAFQLEDRGQVAENGTFELRGFGKVFFRPINLGAWTLKRVVLDGEEITDTPYELKHAETVEGLRIVLTDRVIDVSGSVSDTRGQVKDYVVIVQPTRDVDATTLVRFLRTTRSDQDGRFNVRRLPPGEYAATAVDGLEQGQEWDPQYRAKLRDAGRRFTVKEGESLSLDLKLAEGL